MSRSECRLFVINYRIWRAGFPETFAQKKKWAKTHRITHPKIRVRKWIIQLGSGSGKAGSAVPEIQPVSEYQL